MGSASARAAYSRAVSRHHGSSTALARTPVRQFVADVCGGEVFLEGVVGKAVQSALALDEQPIGPDVGDKAFGGDLARQAAQRGPDLRKYLVMWEVGPGAAGPPCRP